MGASENLRAEEVVFVSKEEGCDLKNAEYAASLSHINLDEATKTFEATFDTVCYQTPLEIIKKVLVANGYVLNFENIIASLDSMKLVHRVRFKSKKSEDAALFMPAVSFRLPGRQSDGELLGYFYDELTNYGEEAVKKEKESEKTKGKNKSELEKELAQQRSYTLELEDKIKSLKKEIEDLRANMKFISTDEGETLPEHLRVGVVKKVDLAGRVITVAFNKTTLKVPLKICYHKAKKDEPVLVSLLEGKADKVMFHESKRDPFDVRMAQVVYAENNRIKIRDSQRRTWVLPLYPNLDSKEDLSLKRGDRLIISLMEGNIARFEKVGVLSSLLLTMNHQEKTIEQQVIFENVRKMEKEVKDLKEMPDSEGTWKG